MIHLSSLWTVGVIYFCEKPAALAIFAVFLGLVFSYEIIRRQDNRVARVLERLLGGVLRPDEKGEKFKPSGAVYVLLAACISTLIFPKLIAMTAMAMMLVADVPAALIGRKFGKTKILNKSLEGSAAFFVAALLVVFLMAMLMPVDGRYLLAGSVAALIAAAAELVSGRLRIDDNLSVPLVAGAVMLLLI